MSEAKQWMCFVIGAFMWFFVLFLVRYSEEEHYTEKPQELHITSRANAKDVGHFKKLSDELEANPRCLVELKMLNDKITHLEKINFGKSGPTDYAARSFGGKIVAVGSSLKTYSSYLGKLQNFFASFHENDDQKQCIIQDCGICYAIPGHAGFVLMKLMGNVFLDAITIEHLPIYAAPYKEKTYSALKEFSVYGMKNSRDHGSEVYFGTFSFNYENDFLETFKLNSEPSTPSVRYVRVDIHSNHGENFTCIYRIRIHGSLDQ